MSSTIISRPRPGRAHSALLVLLLVVTFIVTGVLTLLGQRATNDHQETLHNLLRDHAAFAATQYAEGINSQINALFLTLFMDVGEKTGPEFESVRLSFPPAFVKQCSCNPLEHVTTQFTYDYATSKLVLSKGELQPEDKARLISILRDHPTEKFRKGWRMAFAVNTPGPRGELVGFVVRQDEQKSPVPEPLQYAHGFLGSMRVAREMLWGSEKLNNDMPRGGTEPRGEEHVPRFALTVSAQNNKILDEGEKSEFQASSEMNPAFGGMLATVHVTPAAVPVIASSRLPGQRTPFLFGLMLLAGILIAAALIQARRQSELAASREDFVSSVSHELRTPLAQIRMFAETLLLGRVRNEVERRRALEVIDQEAKRLTALVENVLHLSRSQRRTTRLAPAATELSPTVREVIDTFGQMPRSRSIEFRLELEDRLVATVDPGAFRQILLNLLDNAVKYGPSGQRVSVGLAMFAEHARIWVDDEGPGIAQRERERVFEPFYRSSTQVEANVVGSGIGLAVVRELAGLLSGRAWVEDAPGGGARVVVEFPDAYLRAEEASSSGLAVA